MAKGTITFSDDDAGGVGIKVEFDPPLKRGQTMTNAQSTCMVFVEGLQGSGVTRAMGVEHPDDAQMTTPTLTAEDLAELKRLHEAATPGPWQHGEGSCGPYLDFQAHDDERGGPEPVSDYNGREPVWLGGSVREEDRALIALMRTHLPALLAAAAENAELREDVRVLREACANVPAMLEAAAMMSDRLEELTGAESARRGLRVKAAMVADARVGKGRRS